jgi:V8-like Glu-specific endopeptidase
MSTRFKLLSIIVMCALIALFAVQVNANSFATQKGDATPTESGVMTLQISPRAQSMALDMWTRDAIAAAPALAFPEVVLEEGSTTEALPEGAAFEQVQGSLPDAAADIVAEGEFPLDWALLEEAVLALEPEIDSSINGTGAVFTGFRVNNFNQMHTTYPYKAIGRLVFSVPGGSSSCSASVISPNNIIVTAAHCVYDTVNNRWYSNWVFAPAWRNGSAPYGTFAGNSARVLTAWVNASGTLRRYDVALIRLSNNSAGRPVTYYTGNLGRSWNYNYVQSLFAFGYPSNLGNGLYSRACAAESFNGGTDVLGMGCNMTYGSSGGPWIRVFAPYTSGAVNYVNSVVSGGTPGSNTFYGPRFSSNNIVPLCSPTSGWQC